MSSSGDLIDDADAPILENEVDPRDEEIEPPADLYAGDDVEAEEDDLEAEEGQR